MLGAYDLYRRHNQTATFGRLHRQLTEHGGCDEYTGEALNLVTRMVIVTGKDVLDLDLADVTAYAQARRASGRPVAALPLAYQALHAMGGLTGAPATLAQSRTPGRLTAAQLVDRYPRRRPRRPRRPGPLPDRAGRGARLRLLGQPVPDAGRAVLDRPGASPPRDLLAEPARRRRAGVEAAHPRAARRAAPTELPRRAAGRSFVLPRPAAVVAGRPGPLGTVGRAVPDPRGRRPQLRQGDPPTPGPDAAAHPHPGPGASPTRRRRRGARPAVPTRPARRPGHRARRAVHRGADPVSTHRPGPQPLAAHRSVPHHRRTTTAIPDHVSTPNARRTTPSGAPR